VKIDVSVFGRASLKKYNTLVLVGGNYADWDKAVVAKIKDWVAEGGTLITFQNATAWAIRQEIAHAALLDPLPFAERGVVAVAAAAGGRAGAAADTGRVGRRGTSDAERLDYARQTDVEGAKRINGAIFQSDLDISNPIGFGVNDRRLFINKNGPTILLPSRNKYATVARYTANSFINGYASKENVSRVNNSAAIVTSAEGAGTVVLFADDPTYRSYWLGTNRLFLNALFFGNLLNGGFGGGGE
jgi:hypothetical protein